MWPKIFLSAVALLFFGLVAQRAWYYVDTTAKRHEHVPGMHGGDIVSLANDRYHVEALFTADGFLKLYTLGNDISRVVEVEEQTLTAFLTLEDDRQSHAVTLRAEPQPGDRPGSTSCFCGTLPAELAGRSFRLSVPNFCIGRDRFHLSFRHAAEHPEMPAAIADAEERALHLVSGGKYTEDDIVANGRTIPSQKYRGFQARHDYDPKPGDLLCPVTRTKANPECQWTIGGETYQFCCPPCIDEFVRQAKENPEDVKPPDAFVKQ